MTFRRAVDWIQYAVLVAAAVTAVALFVNDPASAPSSSDTAATGELDGADVYARNCAGCHGRDGSGFSGPALARGRVIEVYPDPADQIAVVTEGRNGMPGFGTRLTAAEIEAVVDYTRTAL